MGVMPSGSMFLPALGGIFLLWILLFVLVASRTRRLPGSRAFSFACRLFHGLMALLPAVWLATFGSLVIRARVRSGEWPRAGYEDPLEIFGWVPPALGADTMPFHALAVPCVLLAAASSLLFYPALAVLDRKVNGERALRTRPLYVLGFTGMLFVIVFDPGGFFAW
jgi:hypothetical protein